MKSHSEIYSCNYENLLTVEMNSRILRYVAVITRKEVTIVRYSQILRDLVTVMRNSC